MEPEADFQKANCHSEHYGTCLVGSSHVQCVCSGGGGVGAEDHIMVGHTFRRNWRWDCLKGFWDSLKWKSGRLLGLLLESIQIGSQLVLTRLSGWTVGDRVNRPRQWCCCLGEGPKNPDRPDNWRQSQYSQLLPRSPKKKNTPYTHMHPSSTSIISPSFRLWVQLPPLLPSCSGPITKLSAQIKEAAHLTAAQHFNIYTHPLKTHTLLCNHPVDITQSTHPQTLLHMYTLLCSTAKQLMRHSHIAQPTWPHQLRTHTVGHIEDEAGSCNEQSDCYIFFIDCWNN